MQLILKQAESKGVSPKTQSSSDQALGSELFKKKKFQITSVYVHTRPGAHRGSGLSWSSRIAGNCTPLEEQYRFSTAEASLQPKISTLEQAETASLEGRQLCCMYSFIANLKLHHCSILRSAPKMKRCREGANTPRFLNQGQLVQT